MDPEREFAAGNLDGSPNRPSGAKVLEILSMGIDEFWLQFWLQFAYVFDQFRTPFSDPVSASISHWFVSISESWILENYGFTIVNVDFRKPTQPELFK